MLEFLNHAQKARVTKTLICVDFLFMIVFPEQEIPCILPVAITIHLIL